jgi:hypothetical protein
METPMNHRSPDGLIGRGLPTQGRFAEPVFSPDITGGSSSRRHHEYQASP